MIARSRSRGRASTLAAIVAWLSAAAPLMAQQTPPPPPPAPAPPAGQAPSAVQPPNTTSAPAGTAVTRVTYLSGPSIYVEAGRDDGLETGDTLEVVRDGKTIATLAVAYLSPHRAACTAAAVAAPIAVGDEVRYTPHRRPAAATGATAAAAGTAAAGTPAASGAAVHHGSGLHGRAGVRYLAVKDHTAADAGFTQPALDLYLSDYGVGSFDFLLDVRSRRTYRTSPSEVDSIDTYNNVYRANAVWHLADPRQRVSIGRQFAPSLSVMGLFDGALYEFNPGRWSVGAFAGTEPDPVGLKPSGDVHDYGGYWQYRASPEQERRWEITAGAIGSYQDGNPNREFSFLQGRYHGPKLNAFAVEEIDFYRGWKVQDAGESQVSLTSTFTYLTYAASEHVTFYGGYDNRRNVRLDRDIVTPVTEFDDSHRQGGWGGASFRMGNHFALGGDLRRSTGGPNGTADGYAVNAGIDRLTAADLSFTGRATHYSNEENDGWLYALDIGGDIMNRVHLGVGGGHMEETSAREPALDRQADWYDLEIDVVLGRRWLLLFSGERYIGQDFEDNDQYYASVSYRF